MGGNPQGFSAAKILTSDIMSCEFFYHYERPGTVFKRAVNTVSKSRSAVTGVTRNITT